MTASGTVRTLDRGLSRRTRQRGFSLFGFLLILILLCAIAVVGMKVFPSFVEYRAITSAVKKAQASGTTVIDIQRAFDRSAAIDDIASINGKDLEIVKDNNGDYLVSFAYTKKIELVAPVSLVIDYKGNNKDL